MGNLCVSAFIWRSILIYPPGLRYCLSSPHSAILFCSTLFLFVIRGSRYPSSRKNTLEILEIWCDDKTIWIANSVKQKISWTWKIRVLKWINGFAFIWYFGKEIKWNIMNIGGVCWWRKCFLWYNQCPIIENVFFSWHQLPTTITKNIYIIKMLQNLKTKFFYNTNRRKTDKQSALWDTYGVYFHDMQLNHSVLVKVLSCLVYLIWRLLASLCRRVFRHCM